ncbi:hypothetical protein HNQ94_003256 [Salirhabdus euzebyi]|uniref:Phosphoesterase n=1 Tax=Salirhabdus euzebyi TaxID=394506 RepID=A0A841Q926_9BACI|nr:metallophosphoesterase family protein [Salirhabdus euzebyi]MBB6454767.1 hypothetical protein [Salirhabdus euzebyi]
MKVVVISDTHMPKRGMRFPQTLLKALSDADLIIHLGDWLSIDVYEKLKQFGRIEGVHGNVDTEEIKQLFPAKKILKINEIKIGIVHGHGDKKTTEKRVLEAFEGEEVDCILFGHSHMPLLKFNNKTLLFNPGSAKDKRKMPYYSFGILHIEDDIRAEHIFYK